MARARQGIGGGHKADVVPLRGEVGGKVKEVSTNVSSIVIVYKTLKSEQSMDEEYLMCAVRAVARAFHLIVDGLETDFNHEPGVYQPGPEKKIPAHGVARN